MVDLTEQNTIFDDDDGLIIPEVGSWAEKKYRLVHMYHKLFSTGMKYVWNQRVYIDLFAGAGKARIRKTNKILKGSPLLSLAIPDQFDKYIFCDEESKNIEALEKRVKSQYPNARVDFIVGDSNEIIDTVIASIPKYSKTNKVLSFCFVDPFALNIEFETIKKLSNHFVDFLILLAFSMDGNRNEKYYIDANNSRIDKFLGIANWRDEWKDESKKEFSFQLFLARKYAEQMVSLGFQEQSLNKMILITSDEKNLPLYHLGFFSRHKKGYDFWDQVVKYVNEPTLF